MAAPSAQLNAFGAREHLLPRRGGGAAVSPDGFPLFCCGKLFLTHAPPVHYCVRRISYTCFSAYAVQQSAILGISVRENLPLTAVDAASMSVLWLCCWRMLQIRRAEQQLCDAQALRGTTCGSHYLTSPIILN